MTDVRGCEHTLRCRIPSIPLTYSLELTPLPRAVITTCSPTTMPRQSTYRPNLRFEPSYGVRSRIDSLPRVRKFLPQIYASAFAMCGQIVTRRLWCAISNAGPAARTQGRSCGAYTAMPVLSPAPDGCFEWWCSVGNAGPTSRRLTMWLRCAICDAGETARVRWLSKRSCAHGDAGAVARG
jgi:hypothetical protein